MNKVYLEGVTIDLERDGKVIARLIPAEPRSPLTIGRLNAFLRNLPSLGDDADKFAKDLRAIPAEFPTESKKTKNNQQNDTTRHGTCFHLRPGRRCAHQTTPHFWTA